MSRRYPVTDTAILHAIDVWWEDKWTSPTARQLCELFGWASPATAHHRLDSLVRRGLLERRESGSRRVLYRTVDRADTATGETA